MKSTITEVEESKYGVYVWVTSDGRYVKDSDGNYMLIQAEKGDSQKMQALGKAARYYGVEGGFAKFLSGHRPITEEEYAEQKARLNWGLTPDPLDMGALRDELKYKKEYE